MSLVGEDSEVFTRPLRPATCLYNSQHKGQASIKRRHGWLESHAHEEECVRRTDEWD